MQSAPFDPIYPIVQISKCYVNPELCVSVVSDSVAVVAENFVKEGGVDAVGTILLLDPITPIVQTDI